MKKIKKNSVYNLKFEIESTIISNLKIEFEFNL